MFVKPRSPIVFLILSAVCAVIKHEDRPLEYVEWVEAGPAHRDLVPIIVTDDSVLRCVTCGRCVYPSGAARGVRKLPDGSIVPFEGVLPTANSAEHRARVAAGLRSLVKGEPPVYRYGHKNGPTS